MLVTRIQINPIPILRILNRLSHLQADYVIVIHHIREISNLRRAMNVWRFLNAHIANRQTRIGFWKIVRMKRGGFRHVQTGIGVSNILTIPFISEEIFDKDNDVRPELEGVMEIPECKTGSIVLGKYHRIPWDSLVNGLTKVLGSRIIWGIHPGIRHPGIEGDQWNH